MNEQGRRERDGSEEARYKAAAPADPEQGGREVWSNEMIIVVIIIQAAGWLDSNSVRLRANRTRQSSAEGKLRGPEMLLPVLILRSWEG